MAPRQRDNEDLSKQIDTACHNGSGLGEEEVRSGVKLQKYLPSKVARLQLKAPTNSERETASLSIANSGRDPKLAALWYWQVFLILAQSEIGSVSGLYRQPGMPSNICWLGWFTIRPEFRRRDSGRATITARALPALPGVLPFAWLSIRWMLHLPTPGTRGERSWDFHNQARRRSC
jgi:hypothetical protein